MKVDFVIFFQYLKDKTENQKVAEGKPLCKDFINYINRDHFATCTDRHQFCATEKLEKEDYRVSSVSNTFSFILFALLLIN